MKNRVFALLLVFILCAACAQSTGTPDATVNVPAPTAETLTPTIEQTPEPTLEVKLMDFAENLSAADIAADMGRGWNLGNTMDATGGAILPSTQETSWGNPKTTEEMVKLLADTGFKTLRIPTTWANFIGSGPDYTINPLMLERVQEIVDWGLKYDLYVILNLHHEDWHTPNYDSRPEAEPKLKKVWAQIAGHFAGYSEKLIFEVLNEPRVHGSKNEWSGGTAEEREVLNHYNKAAVDTIRASGGHNDKRFIMIPTYAASTEDRAAEGFSVPDDDRVIISVHAYTPYNFALNTQGTGEWSIDNRSDTGDIDSIFARIDKNFLSKGYTVVMGEFGAMNKDNVEARAAWLSYYLEVADSYGVPCVWWDNGATTGGGELFGLMDRRGLSWVYPELIDVMFA